MTRAIRLTILLGLAILVAPASAQTIAGRTAPPAFDTSASRTVFRSGVDLVTLSVTVTDPRQNYVTGLHKEDFAVYEDGAQQEVTFFAADSVPLDLTILLDMSGSMGDQMAIVQEAAIGFVRTLRPDDRCALIAFNDTVRVLQNLTGDVTLLESAIRQTTPNGRTALYMALYIALKELARGNPKNGEVHRQAIVVLSDGEDSRGLVEFDAVLELARRSGITIYTILLGSAYPLGRNGTGANPFVAGPESVMRSLAQETGGRSFSPPTSKQLAATYRAIAEELATQYFLGYVPRNAVPDRAYRRITVRLPFRANARPRTRMGYLVDKALPRVSH